MSKILGIGGVTIDKIYKIPRMPHWDETEYISDSTVQQGGIVATAMVTASRLGGTVEFIGAVGDDLEGDLVLNTFKKEKIMFNNIKVIEGFRTPTSIIMVNSENGKRSIFNDRGVLNCENLNIGSIDLSDVSFLHIDGFWTDTILPLLGKAKKKGVIITMDPSSSVTIEKGEQIIPFIDHFIPSMRYGENYSGQKDPYAIGSYFLEYGCKSVIITAGEDGSYYVSKNERIHIPAFSVDVVDTTGAGDVFHGAFITGLAHRYSIENSIIFASAVAAHKCTTMGGQKEIPTFSETCAFLINNGYVFD